MNFVARGAVATALMFVASLAEAISEKGFSYWGLGAQAQEFGIALDLSAQGEQDAGIRYDYGNAYGGRFFAGHQFSNRFAIEVGAMGGITPAETVAGRQEIPRRREFSTDIKALYTYPLTDSVFLRAHLGTRFYNLTTYTAVMRGDAWELDRTKLATSDTTAGLGAGFAWGQDRALLLEFERIDAKEPLTGISLSLMWRLEAF